MEVAHVNSAWLVLAMPDAACPQRMGRLLRLHPLAEKAGDDVSAVWAKCHRARRSLRPLPEKAPPWCAPVAVDDYVAPLSGLIHALKFAGQSVLARPLARLLLLAVLQARRTRGLPNIDMVVNVPLYRRRHWRRGYNQSDLLCRPLARWLGCRYDARALKRVHNTAIQHQLTARLRKRNLKNAFRLEFPVKGLHIAIVDDVVTTGSTVAELSRLLLQSGAASVQVWCLCRTL